MQRGERRGGGEAPQETNPSSVRCLDANPQWKDVMSVCLHCVSPLLFSVSGDLSFHCSCFQLPSSVCFLPCLDAFFPSVLLPVHLFPLLCPPASHQHHCASLSTCNITLQDVNYDDIRLKQGVDKEGKGEHRVQESAFTSNQTKLSTHYINKSKSSEIHS